MSKKTHKRRQRRHRKRINKTMKGGAFNENELNLLRNTGFTDYQIESLEDLNIPINEVIQRVNVFMNQGETGFHGNSDDMAEMVMSEILNENMHDNPGTGVMELETIPHDEEEINYLDDDDEGSLHLSDLDDSRMSGYTTDPDESFGGKRKKQKSKKIKRREKSRKIKRSKKTKKQKGGRCYGNGVGANSYDPNYSIYNSRQLQLFPYK